MAFDSIVSGTKTYVPRASGVYVLSTIGFNDPKDELRLTGATRNKDGSISGSVTGVLEKNVVIDGTTFLKRAIVKTDFYLMPDFTPSEIMTQQKVHFDFAQTAGFLNRLLQGES